MWREREWEVAVGFGVPGALLLGADVSMPLNYVFPSVDVVMIFFPAFAVFWVVSVLIATRATSKSLTFGLACLVYVAAEILFPVSAEIAQQIALPEIDTEGFMAIYTAFAIATGIIALISAIVGLSLSPE